MRIRDIDRNQTVKIGMKYGSGFLYAGVLADAPWNMLDAFILDNLWLLLVNEVFRIKGRTRQTLVSLQKLWRVNKEYSNYIPLRDREILEMWDSAVDEDTKVIIVDGSVVGKLWLVDERPSKVDIKFDEGLINLVGAMYRQVAEDLITDYELMITAKDRMRKANALANAARSEEQIPTGIIRKCRQIATKNICFDDDGRMLKPPEKVYEIICRKMGDTFNGSETVLPSTYGLVDILGLSE